MTVSIVELTREWTTSAWLCREHVVARRARGWTVKAIREVDQACDDCPHPPQPAAVDFAPTTADCRLPTRAECPRPAPMKAWPKPGKKTTQPRPAEEREAV